MSLASSFGAPPSPPARLRGALRRLQGLLNRRITLERCGFDYRFVLEAPGGRREQRRAATARSRRDVLPPMPALEVAAARDDLRSILDGVHGARRAWPSLALLERALGAPGGDGIHRVEACVLRHAAQSLDQLGDDGFSPGLVVLRRRVELILRRRHGDPPSHRTRPPCPPPCDARRPDFVDTLTEFMDLDRALRAEAPAPVVPSGFVQRVR